jgi:putative aminopeptidase FrvX
MKDIIKRLVEITSPSGREEKVRTEILDMIKDYIDDYLVDSLGNLIAHKKGEGTRVLIDAHMDEIGFVATYIDDKGFVRIEPVGGIKPQILPASRIRFENGAIGTIWYESEEVRKDADALKNLSFDGIYVDIGASSKEEALSIINIGEMATYDRNLVDLNKRLMSKAMDDRIGCAVLVQVIRELKYSPNDLYFVFAVQEEVGLVGAKPSAFRINPEIGIAVDVTGTGFNDTPKGLKRIPVKLGGGPTVKIQDSSIVSDKRVNDLITKRAEELNISYQYEVLPYGGTDGGAIQRTRTGVPTSVISIPTRYIHSASEICDYNDILNCVKLLNGILEKPVKI